MNMWWIDQLSWSLIDALWGQSSSHPVCRPNWGQSGHDCMDWSIVMHNKTRPKIYVHLEAQRSSVLGPSQVLLVFWSKRPKLHLMSTWTDSHPIDPHDWCTSIVNLFNQSCTNACLEIFSWKRPRADKLFDIQHVPAYLNSSPINLPKNVVPLQDTSSHHTARNKLILSSNSVQPTKMSNHPIYTLRSRSFYSSPRSPQLHL